MIIPEIQSHRAVIEKIASRYGTVMLLGGTDSGKTTFCTALANEGLHAGRRVAVVDTDLGQSEIGPPTTLGWGFVDGPVSSLHQVSPSGLYFVGVTSPARDPSAVVEGTRWLVAGVREAGASLILVDTSGMVAGDLARVLKLRKISAIKPDCVLALQAKGELEHILDAIHDPEIHIERLEVHPDIQTKSPTYRAERRHHSFAEYFRGSERLSLDLLSVRLEGTHISIGSALPADVLEELSDRLGVPVLHAQRSRHEMLMVCDGMPPKVKLEAVGERFGSDSVRSVDVDALRHLVVGLKDAAGNTLGIGSLEGLDFTLPEIRIVTPVTAGAKVRSVQFGRMRVSPAGVESGYVDSAEV